jgi:hypothetical protein
MIALADGEELARCSYPTLTEARTGADRFVKGHLINLLTEWVRKAS